MSIKVYKLENGNYALVDSTEGEKIKTLDELKSQNALLSIAGAALAIPAAIVTSEALVLMLTGAGIMAAGRTMFNNEQIRELEGKDRDLMYWMNQGLALPAVLLPTGSIIARGTNLSKSVVQTVDGVGTSYSLATGPVSVGLAVPDLYNDRRQYYIDRGEDFNYESWKSALQFRILNDWRGPESYRGDALKSFGERMTSEDGGGDDSPKAVTLSDVTTTNNVVSSFSVADTLYDFSGNSVLLNWLASRDSNASMYQAMDTMLKTAWPWEAVSGGTDNVIIQIGDRTYKADVVTYE